VILISLSPEYTPSPERVFPDGITMSQVNAQLAADCELEPEIEARAIDIEARATEIEAIALSARKRKRLEPLEEEINDGVINLEATGDSVFVPNRLTNAPGDREGSEDNNGGRRVLPARKKSMYRGKHVRFSDE
jgi:hypothetical protein